MNTATKILIIIAILLILLGGIAFVIIMSANNWSFSKLGTESFKTVNKKISAPFDDIQINASVADIVFVISDDESCNVTFFDRQDAQHSAEVANNTLVIDAVDQQKWYEQISFSFKSPKITVALPRSEYSSIIIKNKTGNVTLPNSFAFKSIDIATSTGNISCSASANKAIKLTASTGNISMNNVTAEDISISTTTGGITLSSAVCKGTVDISVKTGDSRLTEVSCKSLVSTGSTGNMHLNNVIAEEAFSIERSTGDVCFDLSDANDITIKTSTGKIKGSLLSDKIFIAKTNTGSVNVPQTVTGGKCVVTSGTGNITIEIASKR